MRCIKLEVSNKNRKAIGFYKRFGFELKEEVKVPNTDLILYAMQRPAK